MIRNLMKFRGVRLASVGIIQRKGKVLLTKRSNVVVEKNKWCLPGGNIKKWETAKNAAIREIREETGFNVKKIKFLFYHDEFVKKLNLHVLVLVFSVEVEGKEKPNWEVNEQGWFTRREIEKLNFAFTHKKILNKFFRMKNKK